MNASEMSAVQDNRTLAFHGYENNRIASLGQVSVELSCIKGVTTVESVIEEVLIDVTTLEDESNHNSHTTTESEMSVAEEHWYYILIGVVLGVLIMVTITVIAVMYKQKKACFAKNVKLEAAGNQVMSIGVAPKQSGDIEFAGQTMDQKRKSIKQMSKIVEVNESQDADDVKYHKQNKNADVFVSNGQL